MKKKTKIFSSLALALVLGLGTAGCSLDKEKTNALTQASLKLGEAMYKASQAQGAEGAQGADAGAEQKSDETVVDADFEEVK